MTTVKGPGHLAAPVDTNEMSALVRAYDWNSTALGAAENWPASLKTATNVVLACEFPMILLWGPELVQIYNDGRTLMGQKHPAGLGQPTRLLARGVAHQ